ncbi:hypothetical protein QBC38DRAFT_526240 [Podospora fimiseda]|uniref:Heterokaryon incompatibility domain-containing protein n=1 Tax=Podospora fimiseda TaxID=252190 RepID=A0AAN7BQF5_9PEZI|nr:hypothetical protein QBC38DRAFT_526240 [Podospora fimiseda]
MDFLPHPVSGVEPLDIPFVAEHSYTFGSDFWEFPQLNGFGDRWASLPAAQLASLAQSWLYFGTISEFLGREIDYREFQVARSVTARPLHHLLNDWLSTNTVTPRGTSDQDEEAREEQKHLLYEHARFLDDVISLADDFDQVSQSHVKPLPTIVLSIKVLCTTLRTVLWDLVQIDHKEVHRPWPHQKRIATLNAQGEPELTPSAQLMLDVLRLRGWCPFFARKVLTSYNYAIAYYFTRLFRLYSPDITHENCSFDECVAHNADIFSYVPKHIRYGCQCQPMSVALDQVRAIIESGGVPLVRIRGNLKKGIRLQVHRMTSRTKYVVISHVWSDGIGNANANAMPECQLRRLFSHLSKLKPLKEGEDAGAEFNVLNSVDKGFQSAARTRPKYFWIDALCMPPVAHNVLRMRAINRLPAVYQAADRILVLDPALEKLSIADSDTLEQCARLSVSPWIGRCWTFQEAALGPVIEVQCADGTFNALAPKLKQPLACPPPQIRKQEMSWSEVVSYPVNWARRKLATRREHQPMQMLPGGPKGMDISLAMVASLTRCLNHEFRSSFARGVKPIKSIYGRESYWAPDLCTLFVQVWNQLSERATTVPGDMHLILANLLGFDTEPIMRLNKSADRMSCILRSMDGVPMSLFFNMEGPRQKPTKYHRDRWVPLYPSNQKLTFGTTYTNLRNVRGDLYLPNNDVSRTKVAVLVCTGSPDPYSSDIFTIQDPVSGDQYSVQLHRKDKDSDAFATPEIGPYVVAIQLDNPVRTKQDDLPGYLGRKPPKQYPAALFRVRRVVTKVQKLYYHQLNTEYEKSFELVEEEDYNSEPSQSSKRTGEYTGGNLGEVFAKHQRGLFRTVYDCPCTVTALPNLHDAIPSPTSAFNVNRFGSGGGPLSKKDEVSSYSRYNSIPPTILACTPLPETWQLVIEREPPTYPFPLPTRKPFSEALTPLKAHLSVTALDGLVASGCVGFAIAICATMFTGLTFLGRFAVVSKIVLHSLFLIQMFCFQGMEVRALWNFMHLGLVVLYAIARFKQGHLRVLDWAYVVWGSVGHLVDLVARVGIRVVVLPRLLDEYLGGVDGDFYGRRGKKGWKGWDERRDTGGSSMMGMERIVERDGGDLGGGGDLEEARNYYGVYGGGFGFGYDIGFDGMPSGVGGGGGGGGYDRGGYSRL